MKLQTVADFMNKTFLIIKILLINIFHHHTDIFLFQPHEKNHTGAKSKNFTPANAFFCTALQTIRFAETKIPHMFPQKSFALYGDFPAALRQLLKKIAFFFDKTQAVGYKVSIEYRERERV